MTSSCCPIEATTFRMASSSLFSTLRTYSSLPVRRTCVVFIYHGHVLLPALTCVLLCVVFILSVLSVFMFMFYMYACYFMYISPNVEVAIHIVISLNLDISTKYTSRWCHFHKLYRHSLMILSSINSLERIGHHHLFISNETMVTFTSIMPLFHWINFVERKHYD